MDSYTIIAILIAVLVIGGLWIVIFNDRISGPIGNTLIKLGKWLVNVIILILYTIPSIIVTIAFALIVNGLLSVFIPSTREHPGVSVVIWVVGAILGIACFGVLIANSQLDWDDVD